VTEVASTHGESPYFIFYLQNKITTVALGNLVTLRGLSGLLSQQARNDGRGYQDSVSQNLAASIEEIE